MFICALAAEIQWLRAMMWGEPLRSTQRHSPKLFILHWFYIPQWIIRWAGGTFWSFTFLPQMSALGGRGVNPITKNNKAKGGSNTPLAEGLANLSVTQTIRARYWRYGHTFETRRFWKVQNWKGRILKQKSGKNICCKSNKSENGQFWTRKIWNKPSLKRKNLARTIQHELRQFLTGKIWKGHIWKGEIWKWWSWKREIWE